MHTFQETSTIKEGKKVLIGIEIGAPSNRVSSPQEKTGIHKPFDGKVTFARTSVC